MMDYYYDHDEGEQKQMQHSSRTARIYRSGQEGSGDGDDGSETTLAK